MSNINNKTIRRFLRVAAGVCLVTELIFSIIIPKIKGNPVYLDTNDGYIIGFSVALLISIQAIKTAVDSYVKNKTSK